MAVDRIYGTKDNRALLKDEEIRDAFEHLKNHFNLDCIRCSIEGGDELWIRLGLMAVNLRTVTKV